ncbi:MAG: hypothetical protein HC880_00495 [Bacteroidia bacterium]|nr:hypothetical protein [Bacteroidia bacterium]
MVNVDMNKIPKYAVIKADCCAYGFGETAEDALSKCIGVLPRYVYDNEGCFVKDIPCKDIDDVIKVLDENYKNDGDVILTNDDNLISDYYEKELHK